MRGLLVLVTKILIVVLFAALLACQVWVVPAVAGGFARTAPEFAALEVPGILLIGALLLCVQVVLACVWRLLTLTARERIFDDAAFRWVDAIIVTVVAADALIVVGLAVLNGARAGSPIIGVTGIIAVIVATGIALVVVVLRGLLRQATRLTQEMAEVV
ncbi:DUF2975 domain-containing protein [Microbacterium hominis]|uniref:DUF2975 domain-containing protein n=1 Tax=Microbacterium hominis TaxID=162426 RepID=A0A7D4PUF6_9MICO|nr:DUF2975 domain-containing protein [Microbacterium hominis]QKJ19713.1 DUF2975 domain-containing protein [Microbacterium hominis]